MNESDVRAEGTVPVYIVSLLLIVVVVLAAIWVFREISPMVFREVADDHCRRLADGAPDANDLDCHSLFPDGRNLVEEWESR